MTAAARSQPLMQDIALSGGIRRDDRTIAMRFGWSLKLTRRIIGGLVQREQAVIDHSSGEPIIRPGPKAVAHKPVTVATAATADTIADTTSATIIIGTTAATGS
jgi:hypothetical protein